MAAVAVVAETETAEPEEAEAVAAVSPAFAEVPAVAPVEALAETPVEVLVVAVAAWVEVACVDVGEGSNHVEAKNEKFL